MVQLRERVFDTMATIVGVLISAGIIYTLILMTGAAPVFEGKIMPVVNFGQVEPKDTYRDDKKACFNLHITKLRPAAPLNYDFAANTTEKGRVFSMDMPLSAYVAHADFTPDLRPFENHAVGASWVRSWCFELPGTVADWQTLTIVGNARHRRHWFYDTVTPIPPFEIAPLRANAAPLG